MSRPNVDILVLYLSSPSSYGVRLRSAAGRRVTLKDAASRPAITSAEYEELSALRKAQAWDTPIFQRGHAQYAAAIARVRQLEAKELASVSASFPESRPGRDLPTWNHAAALVVALRNDGSGYPYHS
jgi:hypothetical protein